MSVFWKWEAFEEFTSSRGIQQGDSIFLFFLLGEVFISRIWHLRMISFYFWRPTLIKWTNKCDFYYLRVKKLIKRRLEFIFFEMLFGMFKIRQYLIDRLDKFKKESSPKYKLQIFMQKSKLGFAHITNISPHLLL
jgi:hypothetical protein